ncbi:MAG: radical SAM protein [Thermodesulfobacteriota bacterium]
MEQKNEKDRPYQGFEQGPIRPPSEAASLLVRVTRNCPWNRCAFCPVYKEARFSLRPVEHVKNDIDAVAGHLSVLFKMAQKPNGITQEALQGLAQNLAPFERTAFAAAVSWYANGMESVFLQDANSLVIKPADLVEILTHLRKRFPWIKRVTSYARSHTIARISDDDLSAISRAGLNRIHIGMESGSDKVLALVKKGTTKEQHVIAGQKVKRSQMELSEYVMPGLGGKALSREHALETADALNRINPDFIRLRSLAIPANIPLAEMVRQGTFIPLSDVAVAEEILLFLESLSGIQSVIKSDHVLNLFEDLEGTLPEDKQKMTAIVRSFLALSPDERTVYQVGRRLMLFSGLADMADSERVRRTREVMERLSITPENVDATIQRLMQQFI